MTLAGFHIFPMLSLSRTKRAAQSATTEWLSCDNI